MNTTDLQQTIENEVTALLQMWGKADTSDNRIGAKLYIEQQKFISDALKAMKSL
jgi:hypothetical protein